MAVNGSELIDDPFNTIFSPYTDLLGPGFFLIILIMICVALYVKTRELATVSMFMLGSGALLSAGSIFTGYGELAFVMTLFSLFGVVGLIASTFFTKQYN